MICWNDFMRRAVISAMLFFGGVPVYGFQEPYREAYRDFWIGQMSPSPGGRVIPVHLRPDGFSSFLVQVLAPQELQQDLRWDIHPASHGVDVHIAGLPDPPDSILGLSLRAQYQGRGIERHFVIAPPAPPDPPENPVDTEHLETASAGDTPADTPLPPVCQTLAIHPGTLRMNVERLLDECGAEMGRWITPGSSSEYLVDWKIRDPVILARENQAGLQGLLELLHERYQLLGLPNPGTAGIDIYRIKEEVSP